MDDEQYRGHEATQRYGSNETTAATADFRYPPPLTKEVATKISSRNLHKAQVEGSHSKHLGASVLSHGQSFIRNAEDTSNVKKRKRKVKKKNPDLQSSLVPRLTAFTGNSQSSGNGPRAQGPGPSANPVQSFKDPLTGNTTQSSDYDNRNTGVETHSSGNQSISPSNPNPLGHSHSGPLSAQVAKTTGESSWTGLNHNFPQSESDPFDESLYDSPDFDESSSEDESVGLNNGSQSSVDDDIEDEKLNSEGERIPPRDQMMKEHVHALIKSNNPLQKFKEIADIQAKRLKLIPPPLGTPHRSLMDRIRDPVKADEGPIPESIIRYVKSLCKLHACYSLSHKSFNKCSCLRKRRRKKSPKSQAYFKHQLEDQVKFDAKLPALRKTNNNGNIKGNAAPTEDISYYKYAQVDIVKASRLVYRFATSHQWDRHQFFMDLMVDAERNLEVVKRQLRPLPGKKYDVFRNRPANTHPIGFPGTFRNYRLPVGGPLKGLPKNTQEYPRDIFVCAQAVWNLLGVGMYHWMLARDRIKAGFKTPKEDQYLEEEEATVEGIPPNDNAKHNKVSTKSLSADGATKSPGDGDGLKRKPGRPSTHPIDPNNAAKSRRPRDPNAPKRSRGRPRNNESSFTDNSPISRSNGPTPGNIADITSKIATGDVSAVKKFTSQNEKQDTLKQTSTKSKSVMNQSNKNGSDGKHRINALSGNAVGDAAISSLNGNGLTHNAAEHKQPEGVASATKKDANNKGPKRTALVAAATMVSKSAPGQGSVAVKKRRKLVGSGVQEKTKTAPSTHIKRTLDL